MLTFVLLKGWGFRAEVMAPLHKALLQHFPTAHYCIPTTYCSFIHDDNNLRSWRSMWLPDHPQQKICYMGWSLGGLVASRLAALPDAQPAALFTLGTNQRFVADEHWPHAMPQADFTGFLDAWQRRPQDTLRHFTRMATQGCANARALLRSALTTLIDESLPLATGMKQLLWLAETDLTGYWIKKQYPMHHLYSSYDALVPSTAANALAQNGKIVKIINEAGHLFPVTHAQAVADYIATVLHHGGFDD